MASAQWYNELARHLGHPGFLTLAEMNKAKAENWQPSDESEGNSE